MVSVGQRFHAAGKKDIETQWLTLEYWFGLKIVMTVSVKMVNKAVFFIYLGSGGSSNRDQMIGDGFQ